MKNSTKKRGVAFIAVLLCLMMAGTAMAAEFGVVNGTKSLNLRAAGTTSSEWLGTYPSGTWVEIVGSQNNFYQVITPDGKIGYMSKNYLTTSSALDDTSTIAIVNNNGGGAFLNFRQAPNYNAKVLGIFYNGVPLKVLGQQEGWYRVEINGQVGYVNMNFLNVRTAPASSTVATIKTPNGGKVNLRTGPGKQFGVIRQYPGDQYVMVLAKGDGWWYVSVDGMAGFMSSDFLAEGLKASRDLSASTSGGSSNSNTSNGTTMAVVSNPRSTQALNLRQYASTASAVLRKLYNGEELYVDQYGAEWCAVTVKETGHTGYVMTKYITLNNAPSAITRTVVHPSGTYVNLRQSQSLTSPILMRVPHGRQVTVLSTNSEWYKVSYNGNVGYMLSYFLK